MSISIIRPGILDSLQGTGHYGFSDHDYSHPGGAMDRYAAQVANMLAGNDPSDAVIEMHFPGPQILFEQNALIAITGGDFSPMLNDEPLPLWQPVVVRKSTILHFPTHRQGQVAYLAVHGSFTAITCGNEHCNGSDILGRWEGRKLEKNNELQFGEGGLYVGGMIHQRDDMHALPWKACIRNIYRHPHDIFMIPGDDYGSLTDQSKQDLEKKPFILHPSSNRKKFQLRGVTLSLREDSKPSASHIDFGAVQLSPEGCLTVAMADHPPADDRPLIGHIAAAHLPKLAQLYPGESFRIRIADEHKGEELLYAQQQELTILRQACYDHLHELIYP